MAKSKLTLVSGTLLETKLSLYVTELRSLRSKRWRSLVLEVRFVPLVYLYYDDRGSLQFSFFSFIGKLFQFRYFLFDWIISVNRSFGCFNRIRSALHKIYQIVEDMSKSFTKTAWKKSSAKEDKIVWDSTAHSSPFIQ